MKKTFLLTCLLFLSLPNITFGIFSDPLGIDMYKKVDKGLYDIELKYLDKELKGGEVGGSILENIKKRALLQDISTSCLDGELSASDVEKISNNNERGLEVLNKIGKKCFEKDNSVSNSFLDNYQQIIKEMYQESSLKSEKKVDEIYKIGRIGMYSDGVEENSPFDLMTDLDEIDKIIFEENIPYNGINTVDLGKLTDGVLSGLSMDAALHINRYQKDSIIFSGKYKDTTDTNKNYTNGDQSVCTTNTSGLSQDAINKVLGDLKNSSSENGSQNPQNTSTNATNPNNNQQAGGYSKVNDNPVWPCNDFFCIMVKFVTYQHNLLGGGKNLSIEGILKRSNTHLKKFSSTSLIQSNMTTNLFELGLKDLNLPDTFHVGLQVSYKPVPIMNVEKDNQDKESDEFKYKNLLMRYYRNLGLDYERANDMHLFSQVESKLKNILDSDELPIPIAESRNDDMNGYIQEIKKENDFVSSTVVDKKVIEEDVQNFYQEFIELESFTNAILDYTIGTRGVIEKMNDIPKKG